MAFMDQYLSTTNDFLGNPARSGVFYITTPAVYWKIFFSHLVEQHHHPASIEPRY